MSIDSSPIKKKGEVSQKETIMEVKKKYRFIEILFDNLKNLEGGYLFQRTFLAN